MNPQQTPKFKKLRHSDPPQASMPDAPALSPQLQFELKTLTSRQLALSTVTDEAALAMAIMLGIISLEPGKCPSCGSLLRLEKDASRAGGGRFRCSCGNSFSVLANTWLDGSKLQT